MISDARKKLRGLYVIVDPEVAGDADIVDLARQAIEGGARLIQLRDKRSGESKLIASARRLQALCAEKGALFIVNDVVEAALAVEADGVHVGQKDAPVSEVRRRVGGRMIIGCSTNNPQEAERAEANGADYVSVGRLFPTGSKVDTRAATLETVRAVKAAVSLPVCAIGGINESNIDDVIAAGADMAAVIEAVIGAREPRAAARRLAARLRG